MKQKVVWNMKQKFVFPDPPAAEPGEIRKLRRERWAAGILLFGEVVFALYVLLKFPLPGLARIALLVLGLILPALWVETDKLFALLEELVYQRISLGEENFRDLHQSVRMIVVIACSILSVLLLAIAYTSKHPFIR